MTRPVGSVLVVLVCSLPLAADGTSEARFAEAEAVFQQYVEATRMLDWGKAAGHLHPEALATFHRMMGLVVDSDPNGEAGREMFGLSPGQSFKDLAPAEAFRRMMTALTDQIPMMKDLMSSSRVALLGSLAEGDLVHVVHRMTMSFEGAPMSKVTILSLKRDGDTWKALLTADMEEMLTKMAQRGSQ
jgi:hypothetical protein